MSLWNKIKPWFNPGFLLRNHLTDPVVDGWINYCLDNGHTPRDFGYYTFMLGGRTIWDANWPYAWGSFYPADGGLPSRRTVLRLRKAVIEAKIEAMKANIQQKTA